MRRLYAPGCVCIAFSILTGLSYPLVIRWIIDDGIQGGRVDRLNQLALLLVGILVGEALSTYARDYCFNLGAERVAARLRRATVRTLRLPRFRSAKPTWYQSARASKPVSR